MKTLKIESLTGYCDRDIMILHASFQLLKDCVEKEDLFNHSRHYAKSRNGKIAKELYDWWLVRSKEVCPVQTLDFDGYVEDTKQLIKLMKIRSGLWT